MNNTTAELLESLQALDAYEENRHHVLSILPNLVKVYGRVVLVSCELDEYAEGNENYPEYRVAFASYLDTEATGATFDEAVLALVSAMQLKQITKGKK